MTTKATTFSHFLMENDASLAAAPVSQWIYDAIRESSMDYSTVEHAVMQQPAETLHGIEEAIKGVQPRVVSAHGSLEMPDVTGALKLASSGDWSTLKNIVASLEPKAKFKLDLIDALSNRSQYDPKSDTSNERALALRLRSLVTITQNSMPMDAADMWSNGPLHVTVQEMWDMDKALHHVDLSEVPLPNSATYSAFKKALGGAFESFAEYWHALTGYNMTSEHHPATAAKESPSSGK